MNDNEIKDHLQFFKDNIVDFNNDEINNKIRDKFNRQDFIINLSYLKNHNLIIKTKINSFSLTEKGEKYLSKLISQFELESEKERIEFEKNTTDLTFNKWLLKTKWLPHIIAIISISFAIYVHFNSKSDIESLEERTKSLESTVLNLKNESKN